VWGENASRARGGKGARLASSSPKGGPNLRARIIYLRFTQGIAFERLAPVLSDLLGLEISVVRQLSAIPYQDRFARHEGRAHQHARRGAGLSRRPPRSARGSSAERSWRVRRFSLTSLRAANRLKASARLQTDETGLRAGQEERLAVGLPP
jgi:hypothetical protein